MHDLETRGPGAHDERAHRPQDPGAAWFAVGLSPRKAGLTLYGLTFYGSNADLLERLGPHTTGKGCLYVKRLADLDRGVLEEMIARAWSTNHVDEGSH